MLIRSRLVSAAVVVGALAVAFAGFTTLRRPASGRPVELRMWTHHRHMADLIRDLVGQFNATVGREKGIVVEIRVVGDDSWSLFEEAQAKDEGPDLYNTGYGRSGPSEADTVAFYDEMPGFDEWKAQWPDWYWIEGLSTYQGRVYTIPGKVYNSRLIYNRDLFRAAGLNPDKPPASYDELRKAASAITSVSSGDAYGFAYCGADSWPLEWMPGQWAEANGDRAYWDWESGRFAFVGLSKVFRLLLALQRDGSLFPGTTVLTNDALRAQFAEGRIGMFMGEFWDLGVLTDQFPAKLDWAVAPIPTYDGQYHGRSRAMIQGGLWNINGKSMYKAEAWEVVKWFSSYEVRAVLYKEGKNLDPDPVIASMVERTPDVRGFSGFAATLDQDYLATYPYLPGWVPPDRGPFDVLRESLASNTDPEPGLQELEALWNEYLDRYYVANPEADRSWNVFPDFLTVSGRDEQRSDGSTPSAVTAPAIDIASKLVRPTFGKGGSER